MMLSSCGGGASNEEEASNETESFTNQSISKKKVKYLSNFNWNGHNDKNFEISFSLLDEDENFVTSDGYVDLRIVSKNGKQVYSESHRVLKSGFSSFKNNFTGYQFIAYSWKIPKDKIEKSLDSRGTIYLKFKSKKDFDYKSISEISIFGLPEFSEEELSQLQDLEYEKNAVNLNIQRKMDRYIAVTVEKIGIMTFTNNSTEKKLIRIDIIVKNIGNEKISYYSPSPIILGKNNNQFERASVWRGNYNGVFDPGDIWPGVVKRGAIFFETKDNPKLDINELIIETGLSKYSKDSRKIGDGQALLYNQNYVFKYNLSNVKLNL